MRLQELTEAVRRAPTKKNDYERLQEFFEHPMPAAAARQFLYPVIDDDWLNDRIDEMAESDPNGDARKLVRDWIELNMPELVRSAKEDPTMNDGFGGYSVLHGYHHDDYSGVGNFKK